MLPKCQILLIEVKFTSAAITPKELPEHYKAEPRWSRVFTGASEKVLKACGYELLRYFLLGHELSDLLHRPFRGHLANRQCLPPLWGISPCKR